VAGDGFILKLNASRRGEDINSIYSFLGSMIFILKLNASRRGEDINSIYSFLGSMILNRLLVDSAKRMHLTIIDWRERSISTRFPTFSQNYQIFTGPLFFWVSHLYLSRLHEQRWRMLWTWCRYLTLKQYLSHISH
jgi:hypothetical protein